MLVVANLDAEIELARATTPGPHRTLPTRLVPSLNKASELLCAFGDVQTYLPTRPEAPTLAPEGPFIAWCETPSLHAMRKPWGEAPPGSTWREELGYLAPDPMLVAKANHRSFAFSVAQALDVSLPSSFEVRELGELRALLRDAKLPADETWVLKAPLATAGRAKLRRRGRAIEGEAEVYASRLLQRFGMATFEPWYARLADYGVCGVVGATADTLFLPHGQDCDPQGVVRVLVIDDAGIEKALGPLHRTLVDISANVAEELRELGYRGAFGVDAFTYQSDGVVRLNPLCEINARLTFGLAARAHAQSQSARSFRLPLPELPRQKPTKTH